MLSWIVCWFAPYFFVLLRAGFVLWGGVDR
jgi:hypothetical protein